MAEALAVVAVDPPHAQAASVTLRSARGEVVAFCWPCTLAAGDAVDNRLSVLDATVVAAWLSDWPDDEKAARSTEWIERTGPHAYRGRGRVVDRAAGLVDVLGFVIGMPVPCDGWVDFDIVRLDVDP
jgi:hypothetical protein